MLHVSSKTLMRRPYLTVTSEEDRLEETEPEMEEGLRVVWKEVEARVETWLEREF